MGDAILGVGICLHCKIWGQVPVTCPWIFCNWKICGKFHTHIMIYNIWPFSFSCQCPCISTCRSEWQWVAVSGGERQWAAVSSSEWQWVWIGMGLSEKMDRRMKKIIYFYIYIYIYVLWNKYIIISEFATLWHVMFAGKNIRKYSDPNILIINLWQSGETSGPIPKNIRVNIFIPQLARITGIRNSRLKFTSSYSLLSTASSRLETHLWTS